MPSIPSLEQDVYSPIRWVLGNVIDLDEDLAFCEDRHVDILDGGLVAFLSDEGLHLGHL